MAIIFGDAQTAGNGVLPPGIVPPSGTAPTLGFFINPANDPPIDVFGNPPGAGRIFGKAQNELAVQRGGDCVLLFGDLFWLGHIHLIPQRFDLGNVLATSVRNYEVYNGFAITKEVTLINDSGLDGISITAGNDTPPFDILAKKSEFYELTVSTIGPPNIDGSKEYVFTSGERVTLFITGTRIVVFPLPPTTPINEIYKYRSFVHTGLDGTEQRTKLRDLPRLTYAYPFRHLEELMAFTENQFYEWMGRLWAMPQWVDLTYSTSIVQPPDVNIPVVDTANRDFRAGAGELGVIYDTIDNFEAFEIVAVNPTSLDITVPILGTFPAESAVMPVRFANMKGPIKTRPWVVKVQDMDIQFDVLVGADFGDAFAEFATIYKTLPVWDRDLLVQGLQYDRTFDRRMKRVDSEIGLFSQYTHQDYPVVSEGAMFVGETREEIYALKRLLMSFEGQVKTVWMPTFRDDFTIEPGQDLPSGQNEMRVTRANYDLFLDDNKRTREDIIITYVDGAQDLREIFSSTTNPVPPFESVIVDTNFTQDVSVANVARISYLVRRRLSVDTLKFSWTLDEKAEIAVAFLDVLS